MTTINDTSARAANGAAVAAFLSAGIGAFAVGLLVILSESGIFVAPALYGPAGGVSGRTTIATVIWLISWVASHRRWSGREIVPHRSHVITLILIGIGLLFTFPPLWSIF
jgi:hypothetical protein